MRWMKLCNKGKVVLVHYAIKTYRGVDVYSHIFLTSPLVGGVWSVSRPCRFTTGERTPDTYWIGGWLGPRAGLDAVTIFVQI
jgi:hypothetical protein